MPEASYWRAKVPCVDEWKDIPSLDPVGDLDPADKSSEFKFWYSATKATLIALTCTITRATDVPVYWPILLIYFFTLFGITMRRQIQ